MRIQLKTEGGAAYFPGLSRPVSLDTGELSEGEAAEIARLVEAVGFFDRPATSGAPARGAADYRQYTVTVDDGRRQHTVRWVDPIQDPEVQALLTLLRRAAARKQG